jgi:hypothetical protein
MNLANLSELAAKVHRAIAAGKAAADAANDEGACNLDRVRLFLTGAREAELRAAGVECREISEQRHVFALRMPDVGMANKRTVAAQAMFNALRAEGVDCDVFYQVD